QIVDTCFDTRPFGCPGKARAGRTPSRAGQASKEHPPCLSLLVRFPRASLPNRIPIPAFSPHATRRWATKIRGKLHYFGSWADSDGALKKYLDQKDDLCAEKTPHVSARQ